MLQAFPPSKIRSNSESLGYPLNCWEVYKGKNSTNHIMIKRKQLIKRIFWFLVILLVLLLLGYLFVFSVLNFGWEWTGFLSYTTPKSDAFDFHPGKTLWDILQLIIIPAVLALGIFWLNFQERKSEQIISEARWEQDKEVAKNRDEEQALQGYLEAMTKLLLLPDNSNDQENVSEGRIIARVRTLTILRNVNNADRKATVLNFLCEANFINTKQTFISLDRADLVGANLSHANLSEINLSGANFKDANLSGAFLRGANFKEANLSGANLINADLTGADLSNANLTGANFSARTKLFRTNLNRTNLKGIILKEVDLQEANLCEVDMSNSDLWRANLSHANMKEGNFSGACLKETFLRQAIICNANLKEADLSGAYLSYADLGGADLSSANFDGADLLEANLEGVIKDEKTRIRKPMNSGNTILRVQELSRLNLVKSTSKRIIICCDGTWDTADKKEDGELCQTNVLKLATSISPITKDHKEQIVHYQNHTKVTSNLKDRILGSFNIGLAEDIMEVYRFLINYYKVGDEIFLFGFSRGAYIVRSLSGLIRNCGIIKLEYKDMMQRAYSIYSSRNPSYQPRGIEATLFRKKFAVEEYTKIKFIGVWETVGALGNPRFFVGKNHFHDNGLSVIIENAFHALAIDEKRKNFEATLWNRNIGVYNQILEQVWFPGVHSDLGGGYPEPENGLSDISLKWMIEKAQSCKLSFDSIELNPDPMASMHESYKGFYKLQSTFFRPIGLEISYAGDTNESIHPSVIERYKRDEKYRPKNLVYYFNQHPL